MNLNRAIIGDILATGKIEPYLKAGLDDKWLDNPDRGSESVLGDAKGNDFMAYRFLLRHFARHGKIPEYDVFEEKFGKVELADRGDHSASELIDLAIARVKCAIASELAADVYVAQRDGDVGKLAARLEEGLEIIKSGLPGTSAKSWVQVDLTAWLSGISDPLMPTIGARDDGVTLLYPGATHSLVGESEAGKSWLALHWCAQEIDAGRIVAYLDFEDSMEGILSRLVELVADTGMLPKCFRYYHPEGNLADGRALAESLADCSLVVVDGITEAMELVPYSGNQSDWNGRYARFQSLLLNPIADHGPAVLSIDHPTKGDPASRDASGAGHKRRGLSGASYVLLSKEPMGRGLKGYSQVFVAKDRRGYVRTHGVPSSKVGMIHIADLVIDNREADHATEVRLKGPDEFASFRPTGLMERVSKWLSEQSGPVSKNTINQRVPGKREYVLQAVDELVNSGYAAAAAGSRGSVLITHVRLFSAQTVDA